MPIYSYKSLKPQIGTRLFTIVTGEYEDGLICSISHICLESPPEYEALSYVWANSLCNQKDDDGNDLDQQIKAWTYVNGELNGSIGTLWLQDTIGHPIYQYLYPATGCLRSPGRILYDGVEVIIGGQLFTALRGLRWYKRT